MHIENLDPQGSPTTYLEVLLLLTSLDCLPILACDNLDSWGIDHLVWLHFERRVFDDECPNVVTKSISAQIALLTRWWCTITGRWRRVVCRKYSPSKLSWSSLVSPWCQQATCQTWCNFVNAEINLGLRHTRLIVPVATLSWPTAV